MYGCRAQCRLRSRWDVVALRRSPLDYRSRSALGVAYAIHVHEVEITSDGRRAPRSSQHQGSPRGVRLPDIEVSPMAWCKSCQCCRRLVGGRCQSRANTAGPWTLE